VCSSDLSHFVDVGAYNGDTLKAWINYFKPHEKDIPYGYFAFEPSYEQFCELQAYVKSLPVEVQNNIVIEKLALGDKEETLTLSGKGEGTNLRPSDNNFKAFKSTVLVKKLDDLLMSQSPTIIKADVEGLEIPVLEGAISTITRNRPTLVISVYHKCSDIWEIPIWIRNLNRNYKLYLRHHHKDYGDTVCYAIAR
jgi:FkbM family methyltransferase